MSHWKIRLERIVVISRVNMFCGERRSPAARPVAWPWTVGDKPQPRASGLREGRRAQKYVIWLIAKVRSTHVFGVIDLVMAIT